SSAICSRARRRAWPEGSTSRCRSASWFRSSWRGSRRSRSRSGCISPGSSAAWGSGFRRSCSLARSPSKETAPRPSPTCCRRTLHHWLLLALRALVIVLLVAAFARPFFQGDAALAVTGTGPREVVLLLDRSYSMATAGRWDEAVEQARKAIASLGPLDRMSL